MSNKAAVPTVRPSMEMKVIKWMAWVLFLPTKYRHAIENTNFIPTIGCKDKVLECAEMKKAGELLLRPIKSL